ncbi:MAG: BON domain-containing protein [Planctomycetes bacterium]|nr:BON domain-containing protein [Planctomycetota bacterium]
MTTAIDIKSDSQIKSDVLREFKWDATIDETDVGVQVKHGVVTITGTVTAYAKKLAAVEAAHRVHGVLDVVDDIKVKIPSAWERTDQDIASAVRYALQWDVMVAEEQIKSTVSNGKVTLEGTVSNWVERFNAERCIQRLTGVRGVINRITVTPSAARPDQIKKEIEEALERQTEREVRRLGISVLDGVVTITGTVRSWAEKNAMERVALATPGVTRVDDQSIVDPYQ